jgi:hypothetical protein
MPRSMMRVPCHGMSWGVLMQTDNRYSLLERLYSHVRSQSGRMFARDCRLMEKSLSFSFASYFALAASGAGRLDGRSQHLAALFYRNCVYLSAAYQMARMGMPDPAGNNMRTVFETIIWQYAYLCDDAAYSDFLQLQKMEEEKFRLLGGGKWSNTKERALENMRRKYNLQKAMKSLYSREVFGRFFSNPYWVLCQKAHSSTFGANYNTPNMEGTTTIEKRPEELRDTLRAILYLCTENLTCFLNCFPEHLPQECLDKILAFTNEINRTIPPALGLVPDVHVEKLKFTQRFREV